MLASQQKGHLSSGSFTVSGAASALVGEFFVEYGRSETDPTGNPPFALNIVYFETHFLQAGYQGQLTDSLHLILRVGHVAVRHLMDNQTTRLPAAPAMRARATFADADTNTGEIALHFGLITRIVTIGGDVETIDQDVTITNATNAPFFLEAQPDLSSERIGGFGQWRTGFGWLSSNLARGLIAPARVPAFPNSVLPGQWARVCSLRHSPHPGVSRVTRRAMWLRGPGSR